jgi:hypothetical protein
MIRTYEGNSMTGVFQPSDRLTIEVADIQDIRLGDIVAFVQSDDIHSPEEWVHRVIAVKSCGLVTRGDNSQHSDPTTVTADKLLGRITHLERDGVIRPVRGGRLGLWRARLLHAWQYVHRLGRRPYAALRESRLMSYLWRPHISQVRLTTDDGPLIKFLYKGRTVARWWPEAGRFECCKPFDLVILRPDGA